LWSQRAAQKRARSAQLIDYPVAAGGALGARGAHAALPFVAAHGAGGIVAGVRQPLRDDRRVLDRHGGTLGEIRQHRVGRIPQQCDGALAPTGKGWAVIERPFLPVLRRGKDRARERRPHRRAVTGENFRPLAGRAPPWFAPVVAYDGNDVDKAAPADRIVHEVGPGAEPEIDRRLPQFRHQRVGGSKRAPGGAAGKARLPPMTEAPAHARPQPVGGNQRDAAIFEEMLRGAREDRDAVLLEREILDPGAEIENDTGMGAHRVDQDGLQVAAMDDPVGRAVALLRNRAERRARKHPRRPRVHDPQLLGSDHMPPQLLAEAERNQNARCVGRQLNAGADFLKALRLVEYGDVESVPRNRQGRSQPPDPRAGDDDGARGRHGSCLRRMNSCR